MEYIKLSEMEKEALRKLIKDEFSTKYCSNYKNYKQYFIQSFSKNHVSELFYLYDIYFLNNEIGKIVKDNIQFSTSKKMTRIAGKTIYKKSINSELLEIRISSVILLNFYANNDCKLVCGIEVKDPLEALQIILEHEICHAIEFISFGNSNCKNKRFKTLSANIFSHKGIYHGLPIIKSSNSCNKKNNFKVGDKVLFEFKNCIYNGIISNITKRATVMVQDNFGSYIDKFGYKYNKWYVPIERLYK